MPTPDISRPLLSPAELMNPLAKNAKLDLNGWGVDWNAIEVLAAAETPARAERDNPPGSIPKGVSLNDKTSQ